MFYTYWVYSHYLQFATVIVKYVCNVVIVFSSHVLWKLTGFRTFLGTKLWKNGRAEGYRFYPFIIFIYISYPLGMYKL